MQVAGGRLTVLAVGTGAFGSADATDLKRAEGTVVSADGPGTALSHLRAEDTDVDCVVCGGGLSTRVVLDFVETVRHERPTLPVVLVVGAALEPTPRAAFRAGVTDYVRTTTQTDAERVKHRIVDAVTRATADESVPSETASVDTDHPGRDSLVAFQNVVLDASASLMSAELDEIATKVRWTLQSVGEFTDIDRCYVFGTDGEAPPVRRYEWTRDGCVPPRGDLVERHTGESHLLGRLSRFENVHVPDTAELDAGEKLAHDLFTERGTAVVVPLVSNWQFRGFVGFETTETPRAWTDMEISILRTVADTIAHTLERQRREETLQRQNERLDTFASAVSHDLRNPLNVVAGFVDLAQQTGDVSHLDRASSAVDRMEELIADVLTLAREGRTVGETTTVPLEPVVEEAWLAVETDEAALTHATDDLGTVTADRDRLLTVFENLFRNAVEHAGPTTEIRVGRLESSGFYVADDGPGIPDEERGTVFEEGYSNDSEGSGLGLAIVSNVVDAHGWQIEATAGPTGGARFEVTTGEPTHERRSPRTGSGLARERLSD